MPRIQARTAAPADGAAAVDTPAALDRFAAALTRFGQAVADADALHDRVADLIERTARRELWSAAGEQRAAVASTDAAAAAVWSANVVPPFIADHRGPTAWRAAVLADVSRLADLARRHRHRPGERDPGWPALAAGVSAAADRLRDVATAERATPATGPLSSRTRFAQLSALAAVYPAAVRHGHWRSTAWRVDLKRWEVEPSSPDELRAWRSANAGPADDLLSDLTAAVERVCDVTPWPDIAALAAAQGAVTEWADEGHQRFVVGVDMWAVTPRTFAQTDLADWEQRGRRALATLALIVRQSAAAGRDVEHTDAASAGIAPPPAIDPDATDRAILRALGKAPGPLLFADLAAAADRSDKTCRDHAERLIRWGLMHRVGNGRSGVTVTPAGRAAVDRPRAGR